MDNSHPQPPQPKRMQLQGPSASPSSLVVLLLNHNYVLTRTHYLQPKFSRVDHPNLLSTLTVSLMLMTQQVRRKYAREGVLLKLLVPLACHLVLVPLASHLLLARHLAPQPGGTIVRGNKEGKQGQERFKVCGQPMTSEGHTQFRGQCYCPHAPGQVSQQEWLRENKQAKKKQQQGMQ